MSNSGPDYEKILTDFKQKKSSRIRRQIKNVLKLINLCQNQIILEVGVATGKFSSIVTKQNTVYALDISFDNLKRARETVRELGRTEGLLCVQADCARLPMHKEVFDKVLAIDIIEHLTDLVFSRLCAEAYRVLKPEGRLYIYTPNLWHPFELARPFRPVLRREHIGVRSSRKICKFLKDAHFCIERCYFNNFFRRISIVVKKDRIPSS